MERRPVTREPLETMALLQLGLGDIPSLGFGTVFPLLLFSFGAFHANVTTTAGVTDTICLYAEPAYSFYILQNIYLANLLECNFPNGRRTYYTI
ncbi:hypothetical protein DAI22_10g024050 [Oryza sativa Japonica Group]|nr:hypothetical protein DAI22_10g024050 [Oryza sativa Japonica Group]